MKVMKSSKLFEYLNRVNQFYNVMNRRHKRYTDLFAAITALTKKMG